LDEIDCAGRNSLDHAVLIVGYYDGYYKLKNSWGSQWGINGYFYIKMSEVGLCGILEHALYPVV
jgi:C1A family cysteine protease